MSVDHEPGLDATDSLRILFEDGALLAVAKPSGMVTHPAYKHPDGTLADAVFDRQRRRGEARPWLLHRLDRETSGVVLFAKTVDARRALVKQLERRAIRKTYLAVASPAPSAAEGLIDAPLRRDPADRRRMVVALDGQSAQTRYAVLTRYADAALLCVIPLTGRTHQIRAHLAYLGAPILADATYAGPRTVERAPRVMLHAWRMAFRYPGTGEPFEIEAPLPADVEVTIGRLGLAVGLPATVRTVE